MKFSGPMQSWGTNSHFNFRHTDSHPSKSAIIGLIAAALGWKRDNDRISSLNSIHFSVRIDQPGIITKDFHTAHKTEGKKNISYVTMRYYLDDAVFTAAIGIEDDELYSEALNALKSPYFSLSMGRKSLPVPADFIIGTYEDGPLQVLHQVPWQASEWYRKKCPAGENRLTIFTDDPNASGIHCTRKDVVISLSSKGRKYEERIDTETFMYVSNDRNTEHDVFAAIGDF